MDILIPAVLFFGMLLLGARVASAMGVAGIVGLLLTGGLTPTLSTVEQIVRNQSVSLTLVAIPLFLLMAEFASSSGIVRRIFDVGNRLLGGLTAGVGYATVIANGAMAALSGSSVAATGLLARISVPEMVRLGYAKPLALGLTATSGTIAAMIPPSIGLIVYGVVTQTSIGRLLLAGAVPGLLTAIGYGLVLRGWAWVRPEDVPRVSRGSREKNSLASILSYGPDVILFGAIVVTVLGAIYSGAATVTESAALGALFTLGAWLVSDRVRGRGGRRQAQQRRQRTDGGPVPMATTQEMDARQADSHDDRERLSPSSVFAAARSSVAITVMIMALIIMAQVFGAWLTRSGLTQDVLGIFERMTWPNVLVLLALSLFVVFLGMFMSQIEILVITLPLVFPLVTGTLDYHPVWFGIWMTKLLEIGLVSPPLGMNVFVTVSALGPEYEVGDAFRGVMPFYMADVAVLTLLFIFPGMVTWVDTAF